MVIQQQLLTEPSLLVTKEAGRHPTVQTLTAVGLWMLQAAVLVWPAECLLGRLLLLPCSWSPEWGNQWVVILFFAGPSWISFSTSTCGLILPSELLNLLSHVGLLSRFLLKLLEWTCGLTQVVAISNTLTSCRLVGLLHQQLCLGAFFKLLLFSFEVAMETAGWACFFFFCTIMCRNL